MKPERIQFAPRILAPSWGIYRTFGFETFRKAESFSDFVTEMADNHGRAASCSIDSSASQVTLRAPAATAADLDTARGFVEKVAGVYETWITPVEES